MPMMATTTSNSIKMNPVSVREFGLIRAETVDRVMAHGAAEQVIMQTWKELIHFKGRVWRVSFGPPATPAKAFGPAETEAETLAAPFAGPGCPPGGLPGY